MTGAPVIRDAEPTIAEGLCFARFVMEITEGLFRMMLAPSPEAIIAETYTQPQNDLSYENTIIAEIDGVVVGIAAGYTAGAHDGFSDRPLLRAAGRRARRVKLLYALLSAVFRVLKTHDRDDFYLHYIGVDQAYRGHGIGTSLLAATEARAITAESRRLTLDVAAKNHSAIAVYERFGMSIVSSWPRVPLIPPFLHRMAKPLPANTTR